MAGNPPEVTVIIPAFNSGGTISRAVRSVLSQTFQDFEIIVVDDASTDNTAEIVKNYKDERIRCVRHALNLGSAAARNSGVNAARGKYIAFQGSDDEWLPEKLKKQMGVFGSAAAEVGVVYTDMWRITGNEKRYFHSPKIMPGHKIIYERALDYGIIDIGDGTALIRKEVFDRAGGYDERLRRYVDLEMFIRLSKYFYFYHIPEPLINYFDTEKTVFANLKTLIAARKLILEKYYEDIKKDKRVLAKHYLGISAVLSMNEEIEEGKDYFAQASELFPGMNGRGKLLSEYYSGLGTQLCAKGDFARGRNHLVKAVKAYPLNAKLLLIALLSLFGRDAYRKARRIYQKMRSS
ncbi:MAG: glycosyltransferase [bacterium]|nr:glycosyltransferase [bacterium]